MANLVEGKGEKKDWCTPEEFRAVLKIYGQVGLDPCTNRASLLEANEKWTLTERIAFDGTTISKTPEDTFNWSWGGHGLVFVNPPYGSASDAFFDKILMEQKAGTWDWEDECIVLVPARTDAKRWHNSAPSHADALCFWKGRLSFMDPDTGKEVSGTTFPSIVLYYGANVNLFYKVFKQAGHVVVGAHLHCSPSSTINSSKLASNSDF